MASTSTLEDNVASSSKAVGSSKLNGLSSVEIPASLAFEIDIEDDEEKQWSKETGIPDVDTPLLQKYLQGRSALIASETANRSDAQFRSELSPLSRRACTIVNAIRAEEQQTLWSDGDAEEECEDEASPRGYVGPIWPGMAFSLARERMEQSRLYRIVSKLPKGALLHCHMEAMGDTEALVRAALKEEGMCVAAEVGLVEGELRDQAHFEFQYIAELDDGAEAAASTLWTEDYESQTFVPVAQAAASFPNGGAEGFIQWVLSRTRITHAESLAQHRGSDDVWAKFLSCFPILTSLQHYEPLFRPWFRNVLSQLAQDGIRWVEFRAVFMQPFFRTKSAEPDEDFTGMFSIMEEEIRSFQAMPEGAKFWGARQIWTTVRGLDRRSVVEDMHAAIAAKQQFPGLISGYDLVGHEDPGRPLLSHIRELFYFRKACAEAGVSIPLFLHAGETLGSGTPADENLYDAILLGTRRIGHAYSLHKHPLLMRMARENKIMVESCPVSNEVLRFTSSILAHPLPALLATGVPCALCNDDPAILGQGGSGNTHDFWQALQGWEDLGLEGLGSLAENSVRWAAFEDLDAKAWGETVGAGAKGKGVKAERMREWREEWESFCQWVVKEFGAEFDAKLKAVMDGVEGA